jgi:hypothetical protein
MLLQNSSSATTCSRTSIFSGSSAPSLCTYTRDFGRRRTACNIVAASSLQLAAASQQQHDYHDQQQHAFAALKSATPLCLADLLVQQEGNGLTASCQIVEGQPVLLLPNSNVLCVPTEGRCCWRHLPGHAARCCTCQHMRTAQTQMGTLRETCILYNPLQKSETLYTSVHRLNCMRSTAAHIC